MTRKYLEDSHNMSSDYKTYLEERFQGEVYGEALFRTMAELSDEPERARKLRLLAQLERETKEFLLPAVRRAGFSGKESPERTAEGEELGAKLVKAPWHDLIRGFQKELTRFVADFERGEALARPGEESFFQHLTAHERALLDFANRELKGERSGDSLASVKALLRTSGCLTDWALSCVAQAADGR